MPLEFESISHGRIAFGFFNIETEMVLLNHYFLFARDLCHYVVQAAQKNEKTYEASWEVYQIENGADIGNLMGAIYGIDHRGFIGEVYKLFPFPREREEFKQKPEGFKIRPTIEELVRKCAKKINIPFTINLKDDRIGIGEYFFNKKSFHKLIQYIWVGGFPRWKDEIPPDYVMAMKKKIEVSENSLFEGLLLS
jgi:hypothetical protein